MTKKKSNSNTGKYAIALAIIILAVAILFIGFKFNIFQQYLGGDRFTLPDTDINIKDGDCDNYHIYNEYVNVYGIGNISLLEDMCTYINPDGLRTYRDEFGCYIGDIDDFDCTGIAYDYFEKMCDSLHAEYVCEKWYLGCLCNENAPEEGDFCSEECIDEGFNDGYGFVDTHTDCDLIGEGGTESAYQEAGWDGFCCCYYELPDDTKSSCGEGYNTLFGGICEGECPSGEYCLEYEDIQTGEWYCRCKPDGWTPEDQFIYCEDIVIPTDVGDKGSYCDNWGYCAGTIYSCGHYWLWNEQEHKCGCVEGFFCGQYCYEYFYDTCECPPESHSEIVMRSTVQCVPDGKICVDGVPV